MKPNPFAILRVSRDADHTTIADQAEKEAMRATEEEPRLLCQWALGELTTHPKDRLRHELFEVPRTRYEDPLWLQLEREFQRNPLDASRLAAAPAPGLSDFKPEALLRLVFQQSLDAPPAVAEAALAEFLLQPELGPPPLEIRDVLFG